MFLNIECILKEFLENGRPPSPTAVTSTLLRFDFLAGCRFLSRPPSIFLLVVGRHYHSAILEEQRQRVFCSRAIALVLRSPIVHDNINQDERARNQQKLLCQQSFVAISRGNFRLEKSR